MIQFRRFERSIVTSHLHYRSEHSGIFFLFFGTPYSGSFASAASDQEQMIDRILSMPMIRTEQYWRSINATIPDRLDTLLVSLCIYQTLGIVSDIKYPIVPSIEANRSVALSYLLYRQFFISLKHLPRYRISRMTGQRRVVSFSGDNLVEQVAGSRGHLHNLCVLLNSSTLIIIDIAWEMFVRGLSNVTLCLYASNAIRSAVKQS